MFENIIEQDAVVEQLSLEWRKGVLPRALLFYGEPYTGKLSTALELARVVTCTQRGEWSCSCRSCSRHRVLEHPYLILTGSRYLEEETAAASDTLLRTRREGARYLFIRAVRKLTKRLDPRLWEGEEQKLKKIYPQMEELEESLDLLSPEKELPPEEELKKILKRTGTLLNAICEVLPKDNIPIDQIRNIGMWSHTTSADSAKVVILEKADRMSDGSKNALLKMLEEPPENTYYILLTSKKGAIIPTITSRLRHYRFVPRDENTSRIVMEKIFRTGEEVPYTDLRAFFLAWRGVPVQSLRQEAWSFVERIRRGEEWELKEKAEFLKERGTHELFTPFLEELSFELQRRLALLHKNGDNSGSSESAGKEEALISRETLKRWNELIRRSVRRWEAYNLAPEVQLETLYYSMEESFGENR
ncbi:MAG: hypothetical protein ACLFNZ_08230 [Spirochaetaceae bacterium]